MKTAVEWLYDRFLFAGYATPIQWKEEAKNIEKEQIINAAKSCNYIGGATDIEAEEYYNQTYNQNKS
jgi:hypothetical protein